MRHGVQSRVLGGVQTAHTVRTVSHSAPTDAFTPSASVGDDGPEQVGGGHDAPTPFMVLTCTYATRRLLSSVI